MGESQDGALFGRNLVSRILFPAPRPTYTVDSFPRDLVWVPQVRAARPDDKEPPPAGEGSVPCLLLTYPSARFLIIFFHSNAEDLGRCHGFCCFLREQFQVHVLAVEYPGYGVCPGIPTGESVMGNAMAAFRFATETLAWPLESIKVFGRSIGTGPAIGLASLFRIAGLILVTPFLSVRDLFRDRVGPFASLVEERFDSKSLVSKIVAPTMIIHGQRDELISCRHGESLYELLRARKLLISPPEMEHNTNLLTDLQYFVLPMFQFFALPDYAFQDMMVPAWAYDKRRSPFYVRPAMEVGPPPDPDSAAAAKLCVRSAPFLPAGDAGDLPKTFEVEEKTVRSYMCNDKRRQIVCLDDVSKDQRTVNKSLPKSATKGRYEFARADRGDSPAPIVAGMRRQASSAALDIEPLGAKEQEAALQRLEDFAGSLCAREICSNELCVLEERMDNDAMLHQQELELDRLIRSRLRRVEQTPSGLPPLPNKAHRPPAAPRLLAKRRAGLGCGSVWAPSLCSRAPRIDEDDVEASEGDRKAMPGMPLGQPQHRRRAAPQFTSDEVMACDDVADADSVESAGWCGVGARGPCRGQRRRAYTTPLPAPPVRGPPDAPEPTEQVLAVPTVPMRSPFSSGPRPPVPSPPVWAACCRALPSDPLGGVTVSPTRAREVGAGEDRPPTFVRSFSGGSTRCAM